PLATEVGHEPNHVAPPSTIVRRMRIAFLIAVGMMFTMVRHPNYRGAFAGKSAEKGEEPFHGPIRLKTAVREQPMVSQANTQAAGQPIQTNEQRHGFPSEEKRRRQCAGVNNAKPND